VTAANDAAAGRSSVSGNIAVSAVNVFAVVGTSLIAVPVIINHVGVAGYGLWTLAQTLVIYVSTAELGVGPAIGRFVSVRQGEHQHVMPILWMAIGLYALAGAVLVVGAYLAAPALVNFFHVPARFHDEALRMTEIMGWVAFATLMAAASGQVMIGLERYRAFAVSNAAGGVTFLVVLLVLLAQGSHLQYMAYAALAQWVLVSLLRIGMLLRVLTAGRPRLPPRELVRELFGFSARLQVSVMATLLNTQTDRVVVGRVSTTRKLGQVSIAGQIAEGTRFLSYAALNPMISRMAVTYGGRGGEHLDTLYGRLLRRWQLIVVGSLALAVAIMQPLVRAWLGPGHGEAAFFAVILVLAYGFNLLAGPAIAYLRAVGRPGPEGRYGVVTVLANVVLTVALGVAFGAIGVVTATLLAYLTSTVWFLRSVRPQLPEVPGVGRAQWVRSLLTLMLAAAIAVGIAYASVAALPSGIALIGVGMGAGLAFALYLMSIPELRAAALERAQTAFARAPGRDRPLSGPDGG
jgi:O-antigen/teichoic acid export membrane protein